MHIILHSAGVASSNLAGNMILCSIFLNTFSSSVSPLHDAYQGLYFHLPIQWVVQELMSASFMMVMGTLNASHMP